VLVLVRKLTENDLDTFWALRLRALTDNPESFGSTYEETVARGRVSMLQRMGIGHEDENFSLGAFEEALIGTAGFRRDAGLKERHKGYVFGMYVVPEMRGRRAGRALMQEMIAQVEDLEGLEQLHLAVVTTNEAACRLYLSLGFRIYGTAPGALKYGDRYWDEHLMVLNISGSRSPGAGTTSAGIEEEQRELGDTPKHPAGRALHPTTSP
jgi:RimJ/RimL family protein N-acetyltransferase